MTTEVTGATWLAILQQALSRGNTPSLGMKFMHRGQSFGELDTPDVLQRWHCALGLFSAPGIYCLLRLHQEIKPMTFGKSIFTRPCPGRPWTASSQPFRPWKASHDFSAHPDSSATFSTSSARHSLRKYNLQLRNNCGNLPFVSCPQNKCIGMWKSPNARVLNNFWRPKPHILLKSVMMPTP